MLLNMQILKDGAIAAGGLHVLIYWQFLLQRRLSDSIEQYNEPPSIGTSQNQFLWFKSTRRMPSTEVLVLQT